MLIRSSVLASVALIAISAAFATPASADTLQDAISLAYRTNPTLLSQRANQRALDETIPQARSGLRPTVNATANANYSRVESGGSAGVDINGDGVIDIPGSGGSVEVSIGSAQFSLSQTLYSGGRISHSIGVAEANVLSGRENLRSVEQQVLASVIQAYVDVRRDMEILAIRQENLTVLRRQLDEANARFEVGEITLTDVAQSQSRLAQSQADLANAQAQLSVSRAAYASIVGQSPATLVAPPQLPGIPSDFDIALDTGLAENPAIRAAQYALVAAEQRVAAARAEYMPTARLTASYGGQGSPDGFNLRDRTAFQGGASISIPLFTGGLVQSRVAQARELANAAQIEIEGQRRVVLQSVSTAYAQLISTRASLTAGEEAVRAATVAAEGVRQEAQVGLRTTLDVLNQELELRNAQILLSNARRNAYVAQASLLSAMGRLQSQNLVASIEVYDPARNALQVSSRGALPWEGAIEAIDRLAAPPVVPASDAEDAPIDTSLKSGGPGLAPVGG